MVGKQKTEKFPGIRCHQSAKQWTSEHMDHGCERAGEENMDHIAHTCGALRNFASFILEMCRRSVAGYEMYFCISRIPAAATSERCFSSFSYLAIVLKNAHRINLTLLQIYDDMRVRRMRWFGFFALHISSAKNFATPVFNAIVCLFSFGVSASPRLAYSALNALYKPREIAHAHSQFYWTLRFSF